MGYRYRYGLDYIAIGTFALVVIKCVDINIYIAFCYWQYKKLFYRTPLFPYPLHLPPPPPPPPHTHKPHLHWNVVSPTSPLVRNVQKVQPYTGIEQD